MVFVVTPQIDPVVASQLAPPEKRPAVCTALTETCRIISQATGGNPRPLFFVGDSALGFPSPEVEVALHADNPAALLHSVRTYCGGLFFWKDMTVFPPLDTNPTAEFRCRLTTQAMPSHSRLSNDDGNSVVTTMAATNCCDVVLLVVPQQEELERRVSLHEALCILLELGGPRARRAAQMPRLLTDVGSDGSSGQKEEGYAASTGSRILSYFGIRNNSVGASHQLEAAALLQGILRWRERVQQVQKVADKHREAMLLQHSMESMATTTVRENQSGDDACPPWSASAAETTVRRILSEMEAFVGGMVAHAQDVGLFDESLVQEIDHACYRVESVDEYETIKRYFTALGAGVILSESYIFGRPIASILLTKPIPIAAQRGRTQMTVNVLELPAPKPGQFYPTGFEHVEFVVDGPLSQLLERYPNVAFNTQNMHATRNADVLIRFADKGGAVIKFHEMSLERVIAMESVEEFYEAARVPRLVVIDLDDTLISTRASLVESFRRALGDLLWRNVLHDEVAPRMRPTFRAFLEQFRDEWPSSRKEGEKEDNDASVIVEQFLACFRPRWREVWTEERNKVPRKAAVPPGVASLLGSLRSNGFDIVVWTARDGETAAELMDQFPDIGPHVSRLFAYTCANGGKPVPPSELCDLVHKVAGGRAVFIGDSASDAAGAGALKIPFIEATWLHGSASASSTAAPEATSVSTGADEGLAPPPRYSAATPLSALTLVHKILKRP